MFLQIVMKNESERQYYLLNPGYPISISELEHREVHDKLAQKIRDLLGHLSIHKIISASADPHSKVIGIEVKDEGDKEERIIHIEPDIWRVFHIMARPLVLSGTETLRTNYFTMRELAEGAGI